MAKLPLILAVSWLIASICTAQMDDSFSSSTPADRPVPARKKPGLWHRPAQKSAPAQLAYARTLEQQGKLRKSARQYRALVHEWHETREAVEAQQAYARILEERQRFKRAFDEYQYLIYHYAGRFAYDKVLQRQFAIANHVMTERRMRMFILPGFEDPSRALPLLEQLVENGPNWPRTPEVLFRVAGIHESNRDYSEAMRAYEKLTHIYPDSAYDDPAGFRRAHCLYTIALRSPRDESACREALSAMASYISRHGLAGTNRAEAEQIMKELKSQLTSLYYERARFYDKTGKRKSAIICYKDFVRQFPGSDLSGDALERIEILTSQMEHVDDD